MINEATLTADVTLRTQVIPEPSTVVLAGSAVLAALVLRRQKER